MAEKIKEFTKEFLKEKLPDMRVGDTVKVHQRIPAEKAGKKKDKERIQMFEGIVLAIKHGKGVNGTFTVRKIISGVGVEKTYPLHSPNIAKIEITARGKVRRAKLYYLRDKVGKKSKLKRREYVLGQETLAEEPTDSPMGSQADGPKTSPAEAPAKQEEPKPTETKVEAEPKQEEKTDTKEPAQKTKKE